MNEYIIGRFYLIYIKKSILTIYAAISNDT